MLTIAGAEVLLAVAIAYDHRKHKRIHPAYVLAVCLFALLHPGVVRGFQSPAWLMIAEPLADT